MVDDRLRNETSPFRRLPGGCNNVSGSSKDLCCSNVNYHLMSFFRKLRGIGPNFIPVQKDKRNEV